MGYDDQIMANIQESRRVLKELTLWRDARARERGMPEYMVLPNATVNAIAQALPKDEAELYLVKGIKEKKMREYGKEILEIVNPSTEQIPPRDSLIKTEVVNETEPKLPDALPVGVYLNLLNRILSTTGEARIIGEVGQVQERGSAVFFSLKDQGDESVISVFMWASAYQLSGVELSEGMAVIASGRSEIYKPTGRLSFRAETLEFVGEGALRAAYEKLKKKLEKDGLFDLERKRALPELPSKIGLITSKTGAVIHDFLSNLGRYGIAVSFVDSRVEGAAAVRDILDAVDALEKRDIDVLVLVRGGGSLESLQAFNNEHVVRAIASFPKPVICAIGHHEDVPLAQLAADIAPSTPTACAVAINRSWEQVVGEIDRSTLSAAYAFERVISRAILELSGSQETIRDALAEVGVRILEAEGHVGSIVDRFEHLFLRIREELTSAASRALQLLETDLKEAKKGIVGLVKEVLTRDPRRLLASGYAYATKDGKLLRSITQVIPRDKFRLHVSDGTIGANVTDTSS